jgi:hypothetical protein
MISSDRMTDEDFEISSPEPDFATTPLIVTVGLTAENRRNLAT